MNLDPDPTKIRLRPFGRSCAEEMKAAVYIEEADDVLAYLFCHQPQKHAAMSELAQRYHGLDADTGWHSWLITLRASPVLWTDKQVPGIRVDPSSTQGI